MIDLKAGDLLTQYRQSKDIEIERLLSQYGSSLKGVREMYPQLTGAVQQRQLTTALPTVPLFFTPSEAQDMGLGLQEGWMLKMTPAGEGYTTSLITPTKWEITENDLYISPTGEKYTQADLQALLSVPTGGLTGETTTGPLTLENLTEEGKTAYGEYQTAGGQLDVAGWIDLRENQQLETEQVFGKVFPTESVDEVLNYMATNPEGFLADIREIGPTEDMIAFLKTLEFEDEGGNPQYLTDEEIQELFGTVTVPEYTPEGWFKDNILDPLSAGWQRFKYGIESAFRGILPSVVANIPFDIADRIESTVADWKDKGLIDPSIERLGWAKPPVVYLNNLLQEGVETGEAYLENIQATSEQEFLRLMTQKDLWIQQHPELTPDPKYSEDPFKHPELFRDPGYYAYSFTNSLAYSLATMGTILAVSAVATPVGGMTAGVLIAGAPEATSMTEELVKQGIPFEQATEWGLLYGSAAGLIEMASDLPLLGLLFKPIKTAMAPVWQTIFRGVSSQIVKGVIAGVIIPNVEGLEEVMQQIIHNAVLKHYDETQSILEGVSQSYIQATIGALPFGVIGGYGSFQTFRSNLSEETGAKYDASVKKFQNAGLTEGQAQVQAANELAMTPEGEAVIEKAINAAKEEYLEEHPVTPVSAELADKLLDEMRIAQEVAKKVTPVTPEVTVKPKGYEAKLEAKDTFEDGSGYNKYAIYKDGKYITMEVGKTPQEALDYHYKTSGAISTAEATTPEGTKGQMGKTPYGTQAYQVLLKDEISVAELQARIAWNKKQEQSWLDKVAEMGDVAQEQANTYRKGIDSMELLLPKGAIPKVTGVSEIATGKPYTAIVYRGYKVGGTPTDEGLFGKGTYYTTSQEYAETYDGKEVMAVNLKNPFVIQTQQEAENFWNEVTRPVRQEALEAGKTVQEADELAAQAAREWLESQGYDGLIARDIIEKGDEIVVFEPKKTVGPKIPVTQAGMPEAGLQSSLLEEVPAKEVTPAPTGRLVQARLDDYLRLREYNAKAVADRISEIKKQLETKGRLKEGTKGDLRLELARLEAQQELDAIKTVEELDTLIRQVSEELGLRSMPYAGYGGKAHIDLIRHPTQRLFKGYTTRQLEEMLNVYQQARQMMPEAPVLEPTPPPVPGKENIERVKTDPTPASDDIILKKFIDCIKDAKPAREVTEALKHQELSQRSAVFASILQGGEGYKAFEKAKGALRGFLPQGEYLLDLQKFGITDADIERMVDKIRLDESLKPFQKLNTYEAFTNLVMGAIPTEGELLLLEREFGPELAKAIMAKLPAGAKALKVAQDIANVPRTLVTIADLSATFRQGALLAFGQPVQFSQAFVAQLKTVFSENNFKLIDEIVHNNIYAEKAEQHKLYIAPISEVVSVTAREEAFMGRLIERIPLLGSIIRASERAYVTFLNVLRMETWAYYCRQWEGTGKTSADYDKLASFINHASGRGDLGSFSRAAPWLSATFFSPRFIMSRVQVPLDLINTTPAVRKVIARNLVSFVGVGLLAQVLAELGGGDTEKDPRSSDFGKIKIGNTRIDFWAGFQPYVRVIAQIITEERKSTQTGEIYKIDPIDIGVNFFRSKLAPMPGLLWDLKSGKTFIGEELNAENAGKIIFEKLTPMFVQDLIEAVQDIGMAGIGYGILSALGLGIQTYSDNWESAELKLGLPQRSDNLPYTVENEVYDVKDYYSEISQMIGGATYEMLSDKKVPELVLSVAKAKDILGEINLLPNKRLTNINADSTKGDTFEQYRTQWLARQKVTNPEELKQFDKDYPDAYLGNITQAQYALLVEYHSLPEAEKAEFLGRHPELYINPREEWLRTHPQENALLALWGKADIYSPEAQSKVSTLTKQLDIPENALVMKDLDAVSELKLKNQHLFDLLDAYGGLDDTLKGPDGLTARDRAIKGLYADNPEFRDDERRIQALDVGTKEHPTLDTMVEGWVERGQIADELGASSAEMKLWLIDNREVHQWALENGLLSDTGEDWNENILRLEVNYREDFDKYDALGNEASPSYIANDTARADAREAMLFSQGKMTSFGIASYTIDALQKNIPENLVTTYVDYYGIRKKEGVDYSAGWYEDDWYLLEHKDFYQTMLNLNLWQSRDFSKVPTRQVYSLYQTYNTLPKGDARIDFRVQHPEFDAWLVYVKDYAYQSDAAKSVPREDYLAMGFPSLEALVQTGKKIISGISGLMSANPQVSGRYTTPREMPTISSEMLLVDPILVGEQLGVIEEIQNGRALIRYEGIPYFVSVNRLPKGAGLFDTLRIDTTGINPTGEPKIIGLVPNQEPVASSIEMQQIIDFLAKSKVNTHTYVNSSNGTSYVCHDFSVDLVGEAKRAGLPIEYVELEWQNSAHAVAGVWIGQYFYYIEPQSDGIMTLFMLDKVWEQRFGPLISITIRDYNGTSMKQMITPEMLEMSRDAPLPPLPAGTHYADEFLGK